MAQVLLYGATGFSGRAIAQALAACRVPLILGGRDPSRLEILGRALGSPIRVADLEDDHGLRALFRDVRLVVNAAGPFRHTATAMMATAIAVGADYTDLAGEWPVFAAAERLDRAAREAGTMLLPGIGFAVAATDCLLAEAAAATRAAVRLRLAVSTPHAMAPGSIATALGLLDLPTVVREAGGLVPVAARAARAFDFGEGLADAVLVSWPDVVTAPRTTGVDSIATYSEVDGRIRPWLRAGATTRLRPGVAGSMAQLARQLPSLPTGRALPGFTLVAEAEDRWRRVTVCRHRTLDGYAATTRIASAAVQRIRAGTRAPGFQTPAGLFGADFSVACGAAVRWQPERTREPA